MRASLRYIVEVESDTELTALRKSAHDHLAEQGKVSASSSAIEDPEFTVTAVVKGKPAERVLVIVRAKDAEEAEAVASKETDKPLSVSAVFKGRVEAA